MKLFSRATWAVVLTGTVGLAVAACQDVAGVDFGSATLGTGTSPTSPAAACNKTCAELGFECGQQFDACGNPKDCGPCSDNRACQSNGKCACQKKTCKDAGAVCGTVSDGCGGALECGKCANPNEACVDGQCKCQPKSCAAQGAECGNVPDGCGGQYACGSDCKDPTPFCGGSAPNKCGATACVPKSCTDQGKNCGKVSDGCGNVLDCGTCTQPNQTCGGGGVANVCGCVPTTTCAAQGKNCGTIDDGCGGTLDCGSCTLPDTCAGTGTPNVCGCTSTNQCSECCGTGEDNCGRPCTRSTCCGGGGGGGCFAAGTLIRLADGTQKPIEQIRVGDLVASYDRATNTVVSAPVLKTLVHGPETSAAGFVIVHGPAGTLRVTPNHPLLIDGHIRRADTFKTGSRVLTPGELLHTPASFAPGVLDLATRHFTVPSVELEPGNGASTYDLRVGGPGTYFAVDILTVNKQIP